MKKISFTHYICAIISLFLSLNAFSQSGTITGIIADKDTKKPVPFAYVYLFKHNSDKQLAVAFADENGKFFFDKVPGGRLRLEITEVGHETFIKEDLELTEGKTRIDLGRIFMENPGRQLAEVLVSASIGITDVSPQKTVFSAKDLPVAQGGSAGDILKLMPSVGMGALQVFQEMYGTEDWKRLTHWF